MFKKVLLMSVVASAALLVAGCGSTSSAGAGGAKDYSKILYLRGVFTWWDAEEDYKVKKVGDARYMSKAELVADGQPYEFKFADGAWTSGTNCGYKTKEDEVIELGKPAKSNCSSAFENFKFTPPENGVYDFYIDFTDPKIPTVTVEKDAQ